VYFWSHNKTEGYAIRYAIAENLMQHANCTVLFSVAPELLPIDVLLLHCGNRELSAVSGCDIELDPMTFIIYQLVSDTLNMYGQTKNKLSISRLSKVTDRRTFRQTYGQMP